MTSDEIYLIRQDTIESFYEFHREAFDSLDKSEMEALKSYFFVGKEIDVDDIQAYRKQLESDQPSVKTTALNAMKKVFDRLQVDIKDRQYLFDPLQ